MALTATEIADIVFRYCELKHSARMIGKDLGVHHGEITKALKNAGIGVRDRGSAAKYTWKNHQHPNVGKCGELSYMFGRKLNAETRKKIGDAHRGANNYHWSGGRKSHSGGYILTYLPNHMDADPGGFVLEHRLIMERFIGRPLQTREIVHHIDGDKSNNNINNLAIMDITAHARLHMLERLRRI